jgi:hypothetical protein
MLKTSVRKYNGLPTLYINDQPHAGIFSSAPEPYMKNLTDAGFDIVDTHPCIDLGWVGPGQYDYTRTDRRIESYLKQHASAKLVLRFWVGYSWNRKKPNNHPRWPRSGGGWWPEQNREDVIAVESGEAQHPMNASFASLRYREEAAVAICKAVEHIESKYGDRIAMYEPGSGPCGEWFHWITKDRRMVDVSPTMQLAFKQHLLKKYKSIDNLNDCWKTRWANFSMVPLPSMEKRDSATSGSLHSLVLEQDIIEFWKVYNQSIADTICRWAKAVKDGCDAKKAVLVFSGYLWGTGFARSGHMCLDQLLKCSDIDVLTTPFMYPFRQLGGVTSSQSVPGAIRKAGKLHLYEFDGGTHLKNCWNSPFYANPQNIEDTTGLLRRDMNKMLTEGSAGWYMDLRGGYFDSPDLIKSLGDIRKVGEKYRFKTGKIKRQVAVVLDQQMPFYFRERYKLFEPLYQVFKQYELERMGLEYDDITLQTLRNLTPEETAQYKFWIFPGLLHVSDETEALLKKHVFRNKNHVLWCYAAGVLSNSDNLDFARMKLITGFDCGAELSEGEISVKVAKADNSLLDDLSKEAYHYGTYGDLSPYFIQLNAPLLKYPSPVWQGHASEDEGFQISPRFYVKSGGDALGIIPDLHGKKIGLAVKDQGEWISVFSSGPAVPRDILRVFARKAGCHIYTEALGQLTHSENLIGFYSHEDGIVDFTLSETCSEVIEIYGNNKIDCVMDTFSYKCKKNRSYLFYLK